MPRLSITEQKKLLESEYEDRIQEIYKNNPVLQMTVPEEQNYVPVADRISRSALDRIHAKCGHQAG